MLKGKVAVVYGAGAIGTTVARAFAAAGAQVHLGGRTQSTVDAVAADIRASGGDVHTGVVDALDPASVRGHADRVAAEAGRSATWPSFAASDQARMMSAATPEHQRRVHHRLTRVGAVQDGARRTELA